MLYVILNWAKRMVTDTCAACIKQSLRAGLLEDVNGKKQIYSCVPWGVMMFHLTHHTQRLKASSISLHQLCSFPLNFHMEVSEQ